VNSLGRSGLSIIKYEEISLNIRERWKVSSSFLVVLVVLLLVVVFVVLEGASIV
jgi:hypothetical protein